MLQQSLIQQVINAQKTQIERHAFGTEREILPFLPDLDTHALIVSGIRRCGKSTLLVQLLKSKKQAALYLNFEDPRLFGFELSDFRLLDNIIAAQKSKSLFLDEIQVVEHYSQAGISQKNFFRFRTANF
jgi:predicted AAA+ superfamily ATPase